MASPFRMGSVMHIFTTFLIFGPIALYKQGDLNYSFRVSHLTLWMFLLAAYLHAFELDAYWLECSSGAQVKVQSIHWRKVREVYTICLGWRNTYAF